MINRRTLSAIALALEVAVAGCRGPAVAPTTRRAEGNSSPPASSRSLPHSHGPTLRR